VRATRFGTRPRLPTATALFVGGSAQADALGYERVWTGSVSPTSRGYSRCDRPRGERRWPTTPGEPSPTSAPPRTPNRGEAAPGLVPGGSDRDPASPGKSEQSDPRQGEAASERKSLSEQEIRQESGSPGKS
jgi:hypothetical protein